MDKKSTLLIGILILIAIVGLIIVSFQKSSIVATQKKGDTASTTTWENQPATESKDLLITPKTIVTAKHLYYKGMHTFAGEVPLPTPCNILEHNITASKDKTQIFITLSSSIKSDEVCAQVITPARFKLTVSANKNAVVVTTLNGQEIILNIIEAGPDDNLDNFDLYIKG